MDSKSRWFIIDKYDKDYYGIYISLPNQVRHVFYKDFLQAYPEPFFLFKRYSHDFHVIKFIQNFIYSEYKFNYIDAELQSQCAHCLRIMDKEYIEDNHCRTCYRIIFLKQIKEMSKGDVYFVRESFKGTIKIGMSKDVRKRVKELRTGVPFELEVLFVVPSYEPQALESLFHKHFKKKHIRGEWYELSNEDINWIKGKQYTDEIMEYVSEPLFDDSLEWYGIIPPRLERNKHMNLKV